MLTDQPDNGNDRADDATPEQGVPQHEAAPEDHGLTPPELDGPAEAPPPRVPSEDAPPAPTSAENPPPEPISDDDGPLARPSDQEASAATDLPTDVGPTEAASETESPRMEETPQEATTPEATSETEPADEVDLSGVDPSSETAGAVPELDVSGEAFAQAEGTAEANTPAAELDKKEDLPPAEPPKKRKKKAEPVPEPEPVEDDEVNEEQVPEEDMQWYVLKVQSNREDTICEALNRRLKIAGFDKYIGKILVPSEKLTEFKGGRKRVLRRKLYPGYIVVQMMEHAKMMAENPDAWFMVRETPGVGDFTGAEGKPTSLAPHEVERILATQQEEQQEAPKLKISFEVGTNVKIKEGTFENFEGEVQAIDTTNGRVTVMINIFGRSTPVELEYWQVEVP